MSAEPLSLSATTSRYFIGGVMPELVGVLILSGDGSALTNRRHEKDSLFHGQCPI